MNNEKQLPPELVEKMLNYVTIYYGKYERAERCAHVAVNYSEQENTHMFNAVQVLAIALKKTENQRDELVETLKSCKQFIESNLDVLAPFPTRNELDKINEFLKNYEDGK